MPLGTSDHRLTVMFPSKFWNVLECLLSKRERVYFYVTFFRERDLSRGVLLWGVFF